MTKMEPCTANRKSICLFFMEKMGISGIVVLPWRDGMLEFAVPRGKEKDPLQEKFFRRYHSLVWDQHRFLAGFPLGYWDWSLLLGWRNGDGSRGEVAAPDVVDSKFGQPGSSGAPRLSGVP